MMEVKVQLSRTGEEPWGFRLIGGADTDFALTVVKIIPNSSADQAGLQNGDTVSSINGMTTKYMTHDDSRRALAEARDCLVLGVARGLYDPVLDDWEPYYEDIDQELDDSDQPSRPTEVFSPQQFTDVPTVGISPQDLQLGSQVGTQLNGTPYDPNLGRSPYDQSLGGVGTPFSQSGARCSQLETPDRSGAPYTQSRGTTPFSKAATPFSRGTTPFDPRLGTPGRETTGSPFVLPSKPYRPFSTEPIEKIPPLEDPIILNPSYKDIFPDFGISDDLLPKTRFKLPISEQYDPDGTKSKLKTHTDVKTDSITETKQESKSSIIQSTTEIREEKKTESIVSEVKEQNKKEDVTFVDKKSQEVDLAKITISATNIVDESIQKAVIVAEDIKKEIDVELFKTEIDKTGIVDLKSSKDDKSVHLIDKSSKETIMKKDCQEIAKTDISQKYEQVKVAEKIEALIDNKDSVKAIEERKESIKHELEEVVECGSVRQKSKVFEKETENITESKLQKSDVVKKSDISKVEIKSIKEKDVRTEKSDVKQSSVTSDTNNKKSTSRLLAEQRAYIIGLQTIPNIRGSIHSSYHFNLLLKTFFIHLTDVMVALSRFILAEPAFNKDQADTTTERTETTETEVRTYKEDRKQEDVSKHQEDRVQKESKQAIAVVEQKDELPIKKETLVAQSERVEEAASETKHTSAVLEKVKEQVKKESLEERHESTEVDASISHHKVSGSKMAQRVERKSEDLIQSMDSVIHEFQSKAAIEETSSLETKEVRDVSERRSKSKEKNTYVAVVESHTYTNKDVILQEFLSGLSSLQSPEESKTVVQTIDTFSTDSKLTESAQAIEVAKAVIEAAEEKVAVMEAIDEKASVIEEAEEKTNIMEVAKEKTAAVEVTEEKVAFNEAVEEKTAEIHEEVYVTEQNYQDSSEIIQSVAEVTQESYVVKDYKQTEDFLASEREEKIEYEKLHKEVVAEVKEELKAVEEQKSEVVEVEEECEVVSIKRPQTLDLKLAEDPHIVKKKFEIGISESKHSKDIKIEEKKTEIKQEIVEMHEDPHIVKKKFEIEQESTEKGSISVINEETMAVSESKVSTATMQSTKSEVSESKVSISQAGSSFQSFQSSQFEQKQEFSSLEQKHVEQQSSFVARSDQKTHDLTLDTKLTQEINQSQAIRAQSVRTEEITQQITEAVPEKEKPIQNGVEETPVVPPTPLTDEYLFKLSIPFPRGVTPVPPDPSPDAEPISGKDLIPHIETKLNSPILYDPPLPTPPGSQVTSPVKTPVVTSPVTTPTKVSSPGLKGGVARTPVYIKPGLRGGGIFTPVYIKPGLRGGALFSPVYVKPTLKGGADEQEYTKEEIMEIERKSSLLASAIDETIKSIEEYKEEVGLKKVAREENSIDVEVKIATNFNSETSKQQWCIVEQKVTNVSNGNLALTNDIKSQNDSIIDNTEQTETNNVETDDETINGEEINSKESNITSTGTKIEENNETNDLDVIKNTVAKLIAKEPFIKEEGDPLEKYRPVKFDPEEIQNVKINLRSAVLSNGTKVPPVTPTREMYKTESGEPMGTHQGIVDGLEEAVVEPDVAKELGKPGLTEEKIAELISGEAEILREAHVMGLSRVLKSHMNRYPDDSSVDFKKIKPIINSLKDSEVLKALNDEVLEEMMRENEKKKKEQKNSWTTFLQKPQRPVPKAKFGYHGYVETKEEVEKPYKVKIVKQPKPKVAPDYKPKNFNTGLLPWEERALREPTPPPVEREEPLLVPEEPPELLEAVDPLPESELPDLENSGIPLPEPETEKESEEEQQEEKNRKEDQETEEAEEGEELNIEAIVEETEKIVEENILEEMEKNNLAEQLISNVHSMVDPNAPLEQQLDQMRAQIAALAQLPCVIQQSLDIVTKQLSQLSSKEVKQSTETTEVVETREVTAIETEDRKEAETKQQTVEEREEESVEQSKTAVEEEEGEVVTSAQEVVTSVQEDVTSAQETMSAEVKEKMRRDEAEILEEQKRIEKQKKEMMEQIRLDQEGRQIKQRSTPRVGKPKPVFGPLEPIERPLVLPGGRKWRNPKDVYTEEMFKEVLQAQMESINGKTMGFYESPRLPYDERINFMKYEKPPVSLDHLKESETYKLIHNMEQVPPKRVDMLTPVMAECDYREKCRSATPCTNRMA